MAPVSCCVILLLQQLSVSPPVEISKCAAEHTQHSAPELKSTQHQCVCLLCCRSQERCKLAVNTKVVSKKDVTYICESCKTC